MDNGQSKTVTLTLFGGTAPYNTPTASGYGSAVSSVTCTPVSTTTLQSTCAITSSNSATGSPFITLSSTDASGTVAQTTVTTNVNGMYPV